MGRVTKKGGKKIRTGHPSMASLIKRGKIRPNGKSEKAKGTKTWWEGPPFEKHDGGCKGKKVAQHKKAKCVVAEPGALPDIYDMSYLEK